MITNLPYLTDFLNQSHNLLVPLSNAPVGSSAKIILGWLPKHEQEPLTVPDHPITNEMIILKDKKDKINDPITVVIPIFIYF